MGEFERCKTCGQYDWTKSHRCPPVWLVWTEDSGEDYAYKIYAVDAQSAAEKWADQTDCVGDYTIVSGEDETVTVKVLDDTVLKFNVSGQAVPEYHATAVE